MAPTLIFAAADAGDQIVIDIVSENQNVMLSGTVIGLGGPSERTHEQLMNQRLVGMVTGEIECQIRAAFTGDDERSVNVAVSIDENPADDDAVLAPGDTTVVSITIIS